MPVNEPGTESEILIAAVNSINDEVKMADVLAAPLDDTAIASEPLISIQKDVENVEVELEEEALIEPLIVAHDTPDDDDSKMLLQKSNDSAILTAGDTGGAALNTDDDNLMDELHDGSFNTSEPLNESEEIDEEEVDEEEVEEDDIDEDEEEEDDTFGNNDVELIIESSTSSASCSIDDDTETAVKKLPSTAIEIDDDDDDEEQDPNDDELDEYSEKQSLSDDQESRSSVEAIHDDDEQDEEHDEDDCNEVVEMKPIKISNVNTIPALKQPRHVFEKPTKRGLAKIKKTKTFRQKLKARSIKQ